ncbi:MAG: AAA family ATPase [Candidatus Omnitrophica bacterium]|nr:AAA family ATPase [Candidatus Omnitrophota bacterium]
MKNIVIVGFMGTGKTAVSKVLASRLKWQRLCIDDMIEWKVGKPISRIFEEDGEVRFRKIESQMVASAAKDKNVVVDAGGGVVIDEQNIRRLKDHGTIFCLTATPDVILERTRACGHRPLLQVEDPLHEIKELLGRRKEYYKRADHVIETSDITPDEAADEILKIMQESESEKRHLIFA